MTSQEPARIKHQDDSVDYHKPDSLGLIFSTRVNLKGENVTRLSSALDTHVVLHHLCAHHKL